MKLTFLARLLALIILTDPARASFQKKNPDQLSSYSQEQMDSRAHTQLIDKNLEPKPENHHQSSQFQSRYRYLQQKTDKASSTFQSSNPPRIEQAEEAPAGALVQYRAQYNQPNLINCKQCFKGIKESQKLLNEAREKFEKPDKGEVSSDELNRKLTNMRDSCQVAIDTGRLLLPDKFNWNLRNFTAGMSHYLKYLEDSRYSSKRPQLVNLISVELTKILNFSHPFCFWGKTLRVWISFGFMLTMMIVIIITE